MNVLKDKVNDQETLIIEMGDKFDFSKVEAFRSAYQDLDSDVKHITVDLAKTEERILKISRFDKKFIIR